MGGSLPWLPYLAAAAAAAVTFLVYLPALRNGFVNWDDDLYVYDNLRIRTFDLNLVRWAFLSFFSANWHPLTVLSHAADYAVWGLNPLGHHLTSIVIHSINVFLVVVLSYRLLLASPDGRNNERTAILRAYGASAVTGLLFGLHPLHVESVAWASERKDVLCALFVLLSTLNYIAYVQNRSSRSAGANSISRPYSASILFFVLALLSKPMAVTLPVILLLLDWYPFGRLRSPGDLRPLAVEKAPYALLSACSAVLTFLAQSAERSVASFDILPLGNRVLAAQYAVVSYIYKMLWPSSLSPYYPYFREAATLSFAYVLFLAPAYVCAMIIVFLSRKKKMWLAVWSSYLILLLPVSGLVQVGTQVMADRYAYLPSIGPFLLAGLGAAFLFGKIRDAHRGRFMFFIAAAAAFVVLSFVTIGQIRIWKDGVTLWTRATERIQQSQRNYFTSYIAYCNLGLAYAQQGDFQRAMANYDRSIELYSRAASPYIYRGMIYKQLGRWDEALADFTEALKRDGKRADALGNRALVYRNTGRFQEAVNDYTAAIELEPNKPEAYYNRGNAYAKLGRNEDAIRDYTAAIANNPSGDPDYYHNRSVLYAKIGRRDEARRDAQEEERLRRTASRK